MAVTNAIIARGAIPTSAGTAYTVPTGATADVTAIVFTNTTAGALTVTLNLVPSGGTAATANELFDAFSVAAHATSITQVPLPLAAGDFIVWVASGSGLNGVIVGEVQV